MSAQGIGFIGIGKMGWPMATRLVRAGVDVTVHDIDTARAEDFIRQTGGGSTGTLQGIARKCDFVITMLPESRIVEEVLFGSNGLAKELTPGKTVIDMTSGVPGMTVEFAKRLSKLEVAMIDAPVSGGVARAETGELAIMVGGSAEHVQTCTPILEKLGRIIPTGELGTGQAMKALNNLVSAGGFLIGIEALLIGRSFGLDPEMMVDVLNISSGMNNSTQKKFNQFVLSGRYDSGFALDLMVKDLTIAMDVSRGGKVAAPFSALCRELWAAAQSVLGRGADHTEIAKLSQKLAGLTIQAPHQ